MNVRIVIGSERFIVREGLRALLERHGGLQVIAMAGDGRAVVQQARELRPDLVIVGMSMPELNGVDAARQIIGFGHGIRVILLAAELSRHAVVNALEAGATGVVHEKSDDEELHRAVAVVSAGEVYLSPRITGLVVESFVLKRQSPEDGVFRVLTAREREVLQLIAEGRTTKEIAARLRISVKTVEYHRQQVMRKLDLGNVAGLTKYAIREGLTTLDE